MNLPNIPQVLAKPDSCLGYYADQKLWTRNWIGPTGSTFSHPVGRLAQAAACKAAKAGAIPARDSNSPGIGVERHTPSFQTGIESALPSCPSISPQSNPVCRQRPHTVEVNGRTSGSVRWGVSGRSLKVRRLLREQDLEGALPAAPDHFTRREYRCRRGSHRPSCGGSTPPSCRDWVASIAAMQRSLKPQSTGQHRGDPPIYTNRSLGLRYSFMN